jgi:thiamine-phosphate pyrophosphorylase
VRFAARTGSDRPWFAIGGIDLGRLPDVLAAGARRIAVVRAVNAAADPRAAAAELKAAMLKAPLPLTAYGSSSEQ